MKKTLASGLAAALIAGGLGLTAGTAQASPALKTATSEAAGLLPLDLCDLLPALCGSDVTGPLLQGVDSALTDLGLLGTDPAATPVQLQAAVQEVLDAVVATLTGVGPEDLQTVADALGTQLGGSGLDPAALTQILAQLGLNGPELPPSELTDLVGQVTDTVQGIVNGLTSIGGQTPDPAQVQALIDQITQALAGGDPAALTGVVSGLLTSVPGAGALDPSILTGLVGDVVTTLQGAASRLGLPVPTIIERVTTAVNTAAAPVASPAPAISSTKYFTSSHPAIRGTGVAGASVTVRTSKGVVLGSTTVNSAGRFSLVSRKLKLGYYRVTATQTAPGQTVSPASAASTFRIVSAKPVIKTSSKKKFKTHRPTIKGIGYPGAKITLRSSSGKKLGSAKVRANGTWSIKSKSLSSVTRKVKAVQTGYGKKKSSKTSKIRIR